ncbi:hypothetical protein GFS31_07820 [Leptolyngbya sp. BL0902]|uniref:hypothetical protein n=1 Tax=Leptolyngbya sp. BL0902 TaxID=1115757 RepID=UPI0018E74EDE|nr:hypothetical protein [Leptolyngbya sp. BL0902]QQE64104.1 hypothetical protein GFS31_07820 [Leptolyngbya sp. BL0902]
MLSVLTLVSWVGHGAAQGQDYDIVPPLPVGVVPVPSSPMPQAPSSGQQFVVFVNDTSEATLRQVQMIEPTAFRTTFQGRPVIQAGRFNHSANAQMRVNDLAGRGISAQMSAAPAAQPVFAQTPALPGNVYAAAGTLPPLPGVTVIPPAGVAPLPMPSQMPPVSPSGSGNVEFGQQLSYTAPASPANSYPVNMPPPSGTTALASPAASPTSAPFYVVIPTSANNLQSLSAQVIQLGTPPDRVQMRTEPRGPHVAVGPFADRGLANQWNNFYRDAGFGGSRVFFQR